MTANNKRTGVSSLALQGLEKNDDDDATMTMMVEMGIRHNEELGFQQNCTTAPSKICGFSRVCWTSLCRDNRHDNNKRKRKRTMAIAIAIEIAKKINNEMAVE
eukprot:scaffold5019_cov131-Skeletonema_dohrnii-CCMP3373.AAC.11